MTALLCIIFAFVTSHPLNSAHRFLYDDFGLSNHGRAIPEEVGVPGEREREAFWRRALSIAMPDSNYGSLTSCTHSTPVSSRFTQYGFTLIETLVVIAVLGVLAVIVILNLLGLIGSGAVESANTEAHQVQQAVIAYMQEEELSTWDGVVEKSGTMEVHRCLLCTKSLQAIYTITDGKIASAYAYPDGKWCNLTWPTGEWGWEEEEE